MYDRSISAPRRNASWKRPAKGISSTACPARGHQMGRPSSTQRPVPGGCQTSRIWRLPVGGEPEAFLETQFNERAPRLSPNGKWLAYVSNQAGEDRIQVTAFPDGGQVFTVSMGLGTEAVWSRDGRELFYRTGNQLWAVEVETEGGFTAERPTLLFEGQYMRDSYGVSSAQLRRVARRAAVLDGAKA